MPRQTKDLSQYMDRLVAILKPHGSANPLTGRVIAELLDISIRDVAQLRQDAWEVTIPIPLGSSPDGYFYIHNLEDLEVTDRHIRDRQKALEKDRFRLQIIRAGIVNGSCQGQLI